jgi:hypothetical protein
MSAQVASIRVFTYDIIYFFRNQLKWIEFAKAFTRINDEQEQEYKMSVFFF